ncbi:hypothetical protein B296_00051982 [Ensete ventricosum]|uniref:Uncharacterized protein n=1 Tax=Ensete ventricosum TaxID=4639 RepID=A0A426WY65_ENSVE|nr:hypothetical protein B296_00051982 [Ensete ventricosum]
MTQGSSLEEDRDSPEDYRGSRKACQDGISPKFARSSPKGLGSSLGTRREIAGRRPKTHRKNAGGCRIGRRIDDSTEDPPLRTMVLPSPWPYYPLPCICIPSF